MGSELGDSSVAVETLVLVSVGHEGSDDCPLFGEVLVKLNEVLILFGSPGLNLSLLGVEVLLFDLETDLEAVKAFDRLGELSGVAFFHLQLIEELSQLEIISFLLYSHLNTLNINTASPSPPPTLHSSIITVIFECCVIKGIIRSKTTKTETSASSTSIRPNSPSNNSPPKLPRSPSKKIPNRPTPTNPKNRPKKINKKDRAHSPESGRPKSTNASPSLLPAATATVKFNFPAMARHQAPDRSKGTSTSTSERSLSSRKSCRPTGGRPKNSRNLQ